MMVNFYSIIGRFGLFALSLSIKKVKNDDNRDEDAYNANHNQSSPQHHTDCSIYPSRYVENNSEGRVILNPCHPYNSIQCGPLTFCANELGVNHKEVNKTDMSVDNKFANIQVAHNNGVDVLRERSKRKKPNSIVGIYSCEKPTLMIKDLDSEPLDLTLKKTKSHLDQDISLNKYSVCKKRCKNSDLNHNKTRKSPFADDNDIFKPNEQSEMMYPNKDGFKQLTGFEHLHNRKHLFYTQYKAIQDHTHKETIASKHTTSKKLKKRSNSLAFSHDQNNSINNIGVFLLSTQESANLSSTMSENASSSSYLNSTPFVPKNVLSDLDAASKPEYNFTIAKNQSNTIVKDINGYNFLNKHPHLEKIDKKILHMSRCYNFTENLEEFKDHIVNLRKAIKNFNLQILQNEKEKIDNSPYIKNLEPISIIHPDANKPSQINNDEFNKSIEMKLIEFKKRFFSIFLNSKEPRNSINTTKLCDVYDIKKSSSLLFIIFTNLCKLLNSIHDNLTLENLKDKYFKTKNWEKLLHAKLDFLIENLKNHKSNLLTFITSIKSSADIRNDNVINFLGELIYKNLESYKMISEYFLEIYKCLYNVENTDYKIFIKFRYENKEKNHINDLNHKIHTQVKLLKPSCKENDVIYQQINHKANTDTIKLTHLHFLDYQIQQMQNLINATITGELTYISCKKTSIINLKRKFIINLIFTSVLDDDFCKFIDQNINDKQHQGIYFECIFPIDYSFAFLFDLESFKTRFYDLLSFFEKESKNIIGCLDFCPKSAELGMQAIRKRRVGSHIKYITIINTHDYFLSPMNVFCYEVNYIIKLFLEHCEYGIIDR